MRPLDYQDCNVVRLAEELGGFSEGSSSRGVKKSQNSALHTTPGVTQYMRPEVALLLTEVELDVLGNGLEDFPVGLRQEIVDAYPRRGISKQESVWPSSTAWHTSQGAHGER